jgi:hypothetical protein
LFGAFHASSIITGSADDDTASFPARQCHTLALRLALCLLAAAAATYGGFTSAQDEADISREYKLKAAFLYNFGNYVTWPDSAFAAADAPFVIGVLGDSDAAPYVKRISEAKKLGGRTIVFQQYQKPDDIKSAHIVFLPAALDAATRAQAIRALAGKPVLLVGEDDGFLDAGGMISFSVQENSIKLYVALRPIHRENLKVSAKLLQFAEVRK